MKKNKSDPVGMADAVMSWYTTVYLPIVGMLKKKKFIA